jgi:hypothetical protein
MLDQFQDAISRLVQMFGSLHRDQMDVIRAELDQLHDLTKELHALRIELKAQSPPDTLPVADSLADGARQEAHGNSLGSQTNHVNEIAEQLADPSVDTGSMASPANAYAVTGPGADVSETNGLNQSAPPELPTNVSSTVGPSNTSKRPDHTEASGGGSDRDVIVWLHQRMMTLQQERETRWQKILKLLPGLS